ncbi:MAG: V-type ATP synthase subunit A [Desulfuromonas sp.]|uniref:V-type ATP synthase subunit A n=1 Tax=Desulfuromonas sp. TaxID=892 RepID=UPI000CB4D6DE|nr:V-type ATP synthase subunit A [Desulfuromonas sp.]PLX83501.1 MAG: V-type ATP synthase subunit A [Desulfuromonas sp.]
MSGRITGLSGPTVTVDLRGLKLYDRVFVGRARLAGEVVRLERDRAVVQVYEDTRGLGVGEPAESSERPLTVKLGPGLLAGMFDGLQRPLEALREETGPFIGSGRELFPLDLDHSWTFHPLARAGQRVEEGEALGYVEEGPFRHLIAAGAAGTIASLAEGEITLREPLGHLQDGQALKAWQEWPARQPRPYRRHLAPTQPLVTGQRCIDFLFPLVKGGTAIFPGGFGTGKTVLEQSIAKFADVDLVVYVGCGERGNEMAELLGEIVTLSDPWREGDLMSRTMVVVNTSNMPVAAREASIYTAVTMAEYYRDMGYHVLFLADSISRWAEALREISASLEEMPGEEGYPTYLGSRLSAFLERAGVVETAGGATGSLSMILSVSPPGGDFTEPVTQACLRSAGAFFMLDTSLAHSRHFPAIHWGQSYSLYEGEAAVFFAEQVSPQWEEQRGRCRELLRREEALKEVAEIVGMEGLQDADRLLMVAAERIRREFLCQNAYTEDAFSPPEKTLAAIGEILAFYAGAEERLAAGEALDEILSR